MCRGTAGQIIESCSAAGTAIKACCERAGGELVSTLPWAVSFPSDVGNFVPGAFRDIPLHPTQLYMSLNAFLVFVACAWVIRHKRFHGQAIAVCLMLYAVGRSLIELVRGDPDRGYIFGDPAVLGRAGQGWILFQTPGFSLTTSQLLGAACFVGGLLLWWIGSRRPLPRPALSSSPAAPAAGGGSKAAGT